MSREKQIEEMAKDIASTPMGTVKPDLTFTEMGEVYKGKFICRIAKHLCNAGYRKASEVAREIFEEIEKSIADLEYQAKTPRKTVKVEELKAQCDWILHEVIPKALAELKKKYESEKDDGN